MNSRITKKLIYEIAMSVLAIATVSITLMDLTGHIPTGSNLLYVDSTILVVFAIDYFSRLILSKNKKYFFKSNIFDLIAIIPFSSLFRLFRLARLLRILKLTKLFKMAVFFKRFQKMSSGFLKTNGLIYIIYVTIATILIGSVAIYFVEKGITINSFPDAIWWAFVTATTVGYGDISPETGLGRVIAAILMLTGIGFIGMLTGTIATYFIAPKKKEVERQSNRILDLSEFDDDQYKAVEQFANFIKENRK